MFDFPLQPPPPPHARSRICRVFPRRTRSCLFIAKPIIWSPAPQRKMAIRRLTLEEARAHNARSPVFRIADELLELIFLEVVSARYITTATMAAMQLAGVCSRWCIVVLNRGRLWARLSTFRPVLFRMSLSRSLSASLSLQLDVCDVQTANLALAEIHRVVDLDVSVFPVLAVVAAGEKTAPALRTLSLQYDHTCRSPLLEGWSMPILEKLSLAHTSLRLTTSTQL